LNPEQEGQCVEVFNNRSRVEVYDEEVHPNLILNPETLNPKTLNSLDPQPYNPEPT